MALKARPADALEREALKDAYLLCRTVLHAWEEVIADDLEKPGDGWRFSLQCIRCLTRRHDIISHKDGGLVRRKYDYPEDYEMDEKVTRSELRMEFSRRHDYGDLIGIRERRNARKKKQQKRAS